MGQESWKRVPESGAQSCSATAQAVTLNTDWPVLYLRNMDALNRLCVRIETTAGAANVVNTATGTPPLYFANQLVIDPGEEIRVDAIAIRYFSCIAVAGAPILRWRTNNR